MRRGKPERETDGRWTPSDYALSGTFCPVDEIHHKLDEVRKRVGAKAALLLSADDKAVLSTLCTCVPEGDPDVERMSGLLRRGELLRTGSWARGIVGGRRYGLQELIRTKTIRHRKRRRFPETADDLVRVLSEIARRAHMTQLAQWLAGSGACWVPARVPDKAREARMSTAVLFLEPSNAVEKSAADQSFVVVDEDVLGLTERVNATVQADVRRDDLIMRQFDIRLTSALRDGDVDFAETAHALLGLAVAASSSDVGACYLIDSPKRDFVLASAYLPQHHAAQWRFRGRLDRGSTAVAAVCADERQSIQLPPGIQAAPDMESTCFSRIDDSSPALELATPMPGPLGSPSAPTIGALTIVKLDADWGAFGAYEVALARNAALRLALLNATINAESAARKFTSLSRRAARLRRNSLATDMMQRANRQTWGQPGAVNEILPDDLEVVVPVIDDVLSTLADVTKSETATFRAALPDSGATASHGVTLVRVAAYPESLAADSKHVVQRDTGLGVNWLVAREGRLEYRSDLWESRVAEASDKGAAAAEAACADYKADAAGSADDYVEHHEGMRSELCVPVFVEDRVVGVINLESPVPHAYDAQIDIAQALAEHVGTAIANARLVLAGVLQAHASEILNKGHNLTHVHEPLLKLAQEAPSGLAARIVDTANGIQSDTSSLRTIMIDPRESSALGGATRLPDLIDAARARLELDFDEVLGRDSRWLPHEPGTAALIVKALIDILDNARRHRHKDHPEIGLVLSRGKWGGQDQDILSVDVRPRQRLKPSRAINVYRCPLNSIEIDENDGHGNPTRLIDEPQLGAYLAGTHARRAGGDVHLAYRDEGVARVVFSVPSPKEE